MEVSWISWASRPSPADATNVASAVFPTATEVGRVPDLRAASARHRRSSAVALASAGAPLVALASMRGAATRARRSKAAYKVPCQAQDESEAAEQLAALEAELEALEDEMEEERLRQADLDEAQTMDKIQQRFKDAAPGLDSEVVPGRGSAAVGVAASVCVCGVSGEDTVAQRVLRCLQEEAVETPLTDFKPRTRWGKVDRRKAAGSLEGRKDDSVFPWQPGQQPSRMVPSRWNGKPEEGKQRRASKELATPVSLSEEQKARAVFLRLRKHKPAQQLVWRLAPGRSALRPL